MAISKDFQFVSIFHKQKQQVFDPRFKFTEKKVKNCIIKLSVDFTYLNLIYLSKSVNSIFLIKKTISFTEKFILKKTKNYVCIF